MNKTGLILLILGAAILSQADDRLIIDMYTESLCPGCLEVQVSSIQPAFNTEGFDQIVKLTIWPYGNARETKKSDGTYTWTCQHGQKECYGNLMLNCGLQHFSYPQNYQFLFCIDEYVQNNPDFDAAGARCSSDLGLSMTDVKTCMNGAEGNQLQHNAAYQTDNLNPKHSYVPWITVQSEHNSAYEDQIFDNLLEFACTHYNGPVQIPACQNAIFEKTFLRRKHQVCKIDEILIQ